MALVGLVVLVFTVLFLFWITESHVLHQTNPAEICTSEDCDKHLYLLQSSIDHSANPCTNFTQYVCGHWNHNPKFRLSKSVLSDMVHAWLSDLNELLEKAKVALPVVSKAVAMFNTCMDRRGSAIPVMKNFMNQHGLYWPEEPLAAEDPFGVMLDLAFNWKVPLFFRLRILRRTKTAHRRRILFGNNKLLPQWHLVYKQMATFEVYRSYWQQFFTIFSGTSSYPSDQVIEKSFRMQNFVFETLLDVNHSNRTPTLWTVKKFAAVANYSSKKFLNIMNSKIRLKRNIRNYDLALFTNNELRDAIVGILGKYSNTELLSYLSWLFVQQYGALANPDQALITLFGDRQSAVQERPRYCAREVEASYSFLVAALASRSRFSTSKRRGIEDLFKSIVEAAVERSSTANWIDDGTRSIAAEKFKKVRVTLWPRGNLISSPQLNRIYAAFPDNASSLLEFWIASRREGRKNFGSAEGYEMQRIAASNSEPYLHYVTIVNAVRVSIGSLSAPAYYTNGTRGMLYGGLGYWFARNVVGAMDEDGVKLDPKFHVGLSWVAEGTRNAFEDRVRRCLGNGRSVFPEVPAIEVAFTAFQAARNTSNVIHSARFTEEQIFFLTACYLSCASSAADNLYGGDCNKAMANFEPFAEAFHCPAETQMNPRKKCRFFY